LYKKIENQDLRVDRVDIGYNLISFVNSYKGRASKEEINGTFGKATIRLNSNPDYITVWSEPEFFGYFKSKIPVKELTDFGIFCKCIRENLWLILGMTLIMICSILLILKTNGLK